MKHIRFLVMTKSSKNRGFCVAGFDIDTGEWIRLVSNDIEKHGALSYKHMAISGTRQCSVGEVIDVCVIAPIPSLCQTENMLISDMEQIKLLGRCTNNQICAIHPLEKPTHIFLNEKSYLTEEEISKLKRSLHFVEVLNLQLSLKPSTSGKMKSKASFTYNNVRYNDISMTDPEFNSFDLTAEKAWIVVSLPNEAFGEDRLYFKFVA